MCTKPRFGSTRYEDPMVRQGEALRNSAALVAKPSGRVLVNVSIPIHGTRLRTSRKRATSGTGKQPWTGARPERREGVLRC